MTCRFTIYNFLYKYTCIVILKISQLTKHFIPLKLWLYTQQQKKCEKIGIFKLIENKICWIQEIYVSIQLVLHVIYISWIQHILFVISLRVKKSRSFAVEYIYSWLLLSQRLISQRFSLKSQNIGSTHSFYLKLLLSQRKLSRPRKLTQRYQ